MSDNASLLLNLLKHGPITAAFVISTLELENRVEAKKLIREIRKAGRTIAEENIDGHTVYVLRRNPQDLTDKKYVEMRTKLVPRAESLALQKARRKGKTWQAYFNEIMDDLACEELGCLTLRQALEGRKPFTPGESYV